MSFPPFLIEMYIYKWIYDYAYNSAIYTIEFIFSTVFLNKYV